MTTLLEQRQFPRAMVAVRACLLLADGHWVPLSVCNVSEGGMLATTSAALASGQSIEVEINPPNGPAMRLPGRVIRTRIDDGVVCVGIAWTSSTRVAREGIRELVSSAEVMAWDAAGGALPFEVARKFVPKIRAQAWAVRRRVPLPPHLGIDDLVGSGFLALVETYAKHALLPDLEFERLAGARIRGAMLDELRRADTVPRETRRTASFLRAQRRDLQARLTRLPTHDELSAASGLTGRAYNEAAAVITPMPQVYVRSIESDAANAGDDDPEQQTCRRQRLDRARRAFDALPERLRRVLEMYYTDDLTLREIGNVLGVSEVRISQLLSSALTKLGADAAPATPPKKTDARAL